MSVGRPGAGGGGGGSAPADASAARWALLRDVAVFQLKLALDALRDVALSPLSLAAAAVGLLWGGDRPGRFFADVLAAGRRSEDWIDLFGSPARPAGSGVGDERGTRGPVERLDVHVARLEALLVEQAERGGLTAATRDRVDRMLDALQRVAHGRSPRGSAPPSALGGPPRSPRED